MGEVEFKLKGLQLIEKTVGRHGTGGIVYVPRAWIGQKVYLILEADDAKDDD